MAEILLGAFLEMTQFFKGAAYMCDEGSRPQLMAARGFEWENGDLSPAHLPLPALPAGWDVSAVSQSGTLGTFEGRAFIALINLNAENSYKVAIRARKRT